MPLHSQLNRCKHSSAPDTRRRGPGDRHGLAGDGRIHQAGSVEQSGYKDGPGYQENAEWGDTPNPFSRVLAVGEPSAKSRFVRAGKTLLVMLALSAVLMAGVSSGRHLLLAHLVSGLDGLDPAAQQNRLTQIAGFGSDAIEPLVDRLRSEEEAVAASAFTLLQRMQNDWIKLPPDSAKAAHDRMLRAIAATFEQTERSAQTNSLRSVQRTRACELLQQSILEFASTPAQASGLLAKATELLAQLENAASSNPASVDSPAKLGPRENIHTVAKVVPVSSTIGLSGWTDWPPPASTQHARIVRSGAQPMKLQALPHGVTAPLSAITPGKTLTPHSVMNIHRPSNRLAPVAANEESDIGKVALQPSEQEAKWKSAGPLERQQMADSLACSGQLETEPWLTLALNDPHRSVRLQVASCLEKTRNPMILTALREHLAREKDPHVAARIRRILDLF